MVTSIVRFTLGVLTVVFFQCMAALLDPAHRRGEDIKWWLVSHTMAMFSFVTVYTAMSLHIQSISFIDHAGQVGYSEPLEFQLHLRESARGLIPNVMFNLNNWLADGLLVSVYFPVIPQFGIPYLSLSVSLNVLLTLMIVIRLVLYGRNVRAATGSRAGISGLYKVISTMLIESCALFTMSSLAVVAPLVPVRVENVRNLTTYYSRSYVVDIFFPILAEIQVRAFPQPQSPGRLSYVMTDRTGDRPTAHCSTGRQPERVDEPHIHHWAHRFIQR